MEGKNFEVHILHITEMRLITYKYQMWLQSTEPFGYYKHTLHSINYFIFVLHICCCYERVPRHWVSVFWNIINLPMSSANPPTGTLQVPVTNCNRRARFSLSIDRTNWNIQCYIYSSEFSDSQTLTLYKPLSLPPFKVFLFQSICPLC
jgi:hypothetical protein